MVKKKLVITQEQFKRINEAEENAFNITANIGTGGIPEINKDLDNPEMKQAMQRTGMDPMFIPPTYKGPKASTTVQVQADGAGNISALPAGTPSDAAIVVKQPTMQESYTKKAVEGMRVARIMENGVRFTKKQVNESINDGDILSREDVEVVIEFCRNNDFIARIIKPVPLFGKDTVCANISRIRNSFLSDLYNPNTKMTLDRGARLPHNVDEGALPIHVWVYDENSTLKEEYIIFLEI